MDLKKVIKRIKPKHINVEPFLDKLNAQLKSNKIKAEAVLGGSLAKDTYLINPDVDIFVKFDLKYKNEDISALLEKCIKKFKPIKIHGSRDYFHIKNYELVPVLDCKDSTEIENVTDMSPLHVNWIKKHIKNKADEVRLVKQFCKANNLYGAESYINGFSGYILEILTIHYGSFNKFIKAVSQWHPKVIIDPQNHYKTDKDILKKLNDAKTKSPVIIIDPVQPERNVAASISKEKFCRAIAVAKKYSDNPAESFFKKKKKTISTVKKHSKSNGTKLLICKVVALDGNNDVAGTKLMKAFQFINKQIELNEFRIMNSGWDLDNFWFELYEDSLPKKKKHMGPLVWLKGKNVLAFLKKHKENVFIDESRFAVVIPRKFSNAKKLLKDLIKKNEVKSRVKKIKC